MINALTLLLALQLVGEVIARGLALPVPGPVIGMGLMFLLLVIRGEPDEDLKRTAGGLLQHLSLLFVPAGTGVMLYFHRMAQEWLPLALSLVISTALTIAVTAGVLNILHRRRAAPEEAP